MPFAVNPAEGPKPWFTVIASVIRNDYRLAVKPLKVGEADAVFGDVIVIFRRIELNPHLILCIYIK